MDLPHFLLDPLNESITSGAFVDTKFYVFSRRDALGRVGSPRPLYCNGKVLSTVPYFSALFSNEFSEGQIRDINKGFPSDSLPCAESYDYFSDSDLEDDEPGRPYGGHDSDSETLAEAPENPQPESQDASEVKNCHAPDSCFARMGKVAVIRDMAAITFEAMIYFLYTGKLSFAPFSSGLQHDLPAEARSGDWNSARPPSPSAKSVYRLADKYDIPNLKELAKAYIHANLESCNIIDEVFSSFSSAFPEVLSVQVSQLVSKMKQESTGDTESSTMRQLLDKIASLSPSQLAHAMDALSMIWTGTAGPLDSPAQKPEPNLLANPTLVASLHRVELALLKSISTGTFIDVQFCAYNAISNNLPLDRKPLFTSSIVIEEWGSAIATQTTGVDSQAVCLSDDLTDDYECLDGGLPELPHKDEAVLRHQTEASSSANDRDVVILISGAWKTWMSLFSYVYTNEILFAPLRTESGLVVDIGARLPHSCSPRSMYSLATMLGIEDVKERALRDIQSKLTNSNIVRELFTSFAANHNPVMETEIEFFHKNFTEKDLKLLMGHLQRMASGEEPYFPTTLSLVYDKRFRGTFAQPVAAGFGLGKSSDTGNRNTVARTELLKCWKCGERARLQDLYEGFYCPNCQLSRYMISRPLMQCPLCGSYREETGTDCIGPSCSVKFM